MYAYVLLLTLVASMSLSSPPPVQPNTCCWQHLPLHQQTPLLVLVLLLLLRNMTCSGRMEKGRGLWSQRQQ